MKRHGKNKHTLLRWEVSMKFPHCVITIYETIETVKISLRKGTGGLTCNRGFERAAKPLQIILNW